MAVEEKPRGDALERLAQVGTYRTLGERKLSPQEERVPITQMVRNGFFFDVIGAILIVIGIPIMVSALGIGG
jgi:hypothetical protein